MKYDGDQKAFFQSFFVTSGKLRFISRDVIVFKALRYFGMFSVGSAFEYYVYVIFITFLIGYFDVEGGTDLFYLLF